jgi:predicted outer membrane repeat protein
MFFSSWLWNRTTNRRPNASRRLAPSRFRPRLESLEVRWLPSTLTVTNPLDDSSNGTLRATIAAAASGDTIVFADTLNGQTVALTGGELLLNKSLNIQGPGAAQLAISGNHLGRVFDVASNVQVSMAGLTIRDGTGYGRLTPETTSYGYGFGGGIYNAGTLTVSSCVLSGNSASSSNSPSENQGGGIYNVNGTLTVSSCTLSGNSAGSFGGGICNWHGTLIVSGGTLSGNSAQDGGGIYENGNATLTGTTLSGNSADRYGGALYTTSNSLTIGGCTLSGNSARVSGGGVFDNYGAAVTISGCTISGNSADIGGGIYNVNAAKANLMIKDSTITNNTANTKGGGIYNNGIASIQNTKMTSNSAGLQGGGMFNDVNGTLALYSSSVVSGNSAPVGGDLYNLGHVIKKKS